MSRLPQWTAGAWTVPDTAEALARLAEFENLAVELAAQQEELSREMAALRESGKERSVQFRELLAQKLANSHTLSLLQARGLT